LVFLTNNLPPKLTVPADVRSVCDSWRSCIHPIELCGRACTACVLCLGMQLHGRVSVSHSWHAKSRISGT